MARWRVTVVVDADDAGEAASKVTGPMREEDVFAIGLYVTQVEEDQ
jgi:hypothetical protein